ADAQPVTEPEVVAPAQPAPAAAGAAPPHADSGSPEARLQRSTQNQTLLPGAGAVAPLLLLLILMAGARRNARPGAELTGSFTGHAATDNSATDAGIEGDDFNVALAAAQDNTPDELDIAEDPLVEADALIAYGKLDQAADALQSAIYEEPERTDLRVKLMEGEAVRESPQG